LSPIGSPDYTVTVNAVNVKGDVQVKSMRHSLKMEALLIAAYCIF